MKTHLELFTADVCSRCTQARKLIHGIVRELDEDRFELEFVDVVKNLDHAVETGVLTTPALAINGKLVFCPLPGRAQVLRALRTVLEK